jgi:hypothetical protein
LSNETELNAALDKFIITNTNIIGGKLIKGFKEKTPVDTGEAQGGWTIESVVAKVGDTLVIANDVPYIGHLNYGTTKMEGHYMVERTVQEVQTEYR